VLQSVNKTRLSTISMLLGIFIKIFINYFLIAVPSVNITGAVIGTIICYMIAIYVNSKYIHKFVPIEVKVKKHMGRPIIASIAMGAVTAVIYKLFSFVTGLVLGAYMTNAISTVIAVIIGAACYGLIMLKIGGIDIDDLKLIPYGQRIIKYIPQGFLPTVNSGAVE